MTKTEGCENENENENEISAYTRELSAGSNIKHKIATNNTIVSGSLDGTLRYWFL